MTRLEVLTELAIQLQDTYKVIVLVNKEFYSLRIYFAINIEYVMEIDPFYMRYRVEENNFNRRDVDYLYNDCCRKIEYEWLRFLKRSS